MPAVCLNMSSRVYLNMSMTSQNLQETREHLANAIMQATAQNVSNIVATAAQMPAVPIMMADASSMLSKYSHLAGPVPDASMLAKDSNDMLLANVTRQQFFSSKAPVLQPHPAHTLSLAQLETRGARIRLVEEHCAPVAHQS